MGATLFRKQERVPLKEMHPWYVYRLYVLRILVQRPSTLGSPDYSLAVRFSCVPFSSFHIDAKPFHLSYAFQQSSDAHVPSFSTASQPVPAWKEQRFGFSHAAVPSAFG